MASERPPRLFRVEMTVVAFVASDGDDLDSFDAADAIREEIDNLVTADPFVQEIGRDEAHRWEIPREWEGGIVYGDYEGEWTAGALLKAIREYIPDPTDMDLEAAGQRSLLAARAQQSEAPTNTEGR